MHLSASAIVNALAARVSTPPDGPPKVATAGSSSDEGCSSSKKAGAFKTVSISTLVSALRTARASASPEAPPKDATTGSLSEEASPGSKKAFKIPLSSILAALGANGSAPSAAPPTDSTTDSSSDGGRSTAKKASKIVSLSAIMEALAARTSVPPEVPPEDATTGSSPELGSANSKKTFKNPFSSIVAALANSAPAPAVEPSMDATSGSACSDTSISSSDKASKSMSISAIIAALAASASVPVVPPLEDPAAPDSSQDCSSLNSKISASKKVLSDARALFIDNRLHCVVCKVRRARDDQSITCSLACTEKFCQDGPADLTICDVCYRLPKVEGEQQCGQTCAEMAKIACLLCRYRPKNGRHDFCGLTCRALSLKLAPLILEIPKGHTTFDMVERNFKGAWKAGSSPIPVITRIYKVVENEEFHRPYDLYRERVGPEECYRYHGTSRECELGVSTKKLCTSSTCSACNILQTSFKVDLAKPSGAFGKGVYTSSASNKAFSYCKEDGALLLNKAVLGRVKHVTGWNEVMSCPPDHDSVVFDRHYGHLNETIFYSDDAIRPVFLIIFR